MKTKLIFSLIALNCLVTNSFAQRTPQIFDQYCLKCHNYEDWAGGLDIETLNFDQVQQSPQVWEKIIKKMRAGMMPPSDQDRPSPEETHVFLAQLENKLDVSLEAIPENPALHRLNRYEYANVIRDLLALNIDTTVLMPQDDSSEGFDNIAASLNFSPALIQGYISSAMKVSRLAIGDRSATESSTRYRTSQDLKQDKHIEGLPLGTRGGLKISHFFPLDAEYDFSVGIGFGLSRSTVYSITLDGISLDVENPRSFRLPISAGEHTLTASIVDLKRPTGVNDIYADSNLRGGINGIEIIGPFNSTGVGANSASRQKIFSCYPKNNDEENACAEKIIIGIASRAFREPVSINQLDAIVSFYQKGYAEGGFETGIEQALSRILIDPRFIFRFEESSKGNIQHPAHAISQLELASRLSFFLWSSIPDDQLIDLATKGQLSQPEILKQQVVRMLADPKSFSLVENFADQWLFLKELEKINTEAVAFNENLRQAFIQETQLLFEHIIKENYPVTDLINADYTFLNERLAQHYNITNVTGSFFRKVSLPEDSPRRGLLGQGSILTITSTATRTSPVIRGSWILENLLSAPVPNPPPGVETNLEADSENGESHLTNSVRERLEAHRVDPNCSSCHSVIDPVGFALENFDSIGGWREFDGDSAVDSTGTLANGDTVNGPADLRQAIMKEPEIFVGTLTEKLLTYALGRGLEYFDMPLVRSIVNNSKDEGYLFSSLILGIVNSDQFLMRTTESISDTTEIATYTESR